jgi:D-3-phosphoglycerate dehydrogenase
MSSSIKFIIDFDSTFTQVEALDILGEISLANHPERVVRLQAIKDITDQGMDGSLTFRESLEKRIEILQANKAQITELIAALKQKVSKSFERNREFLLENAPNIYIISNGFKDFIIPIVGVYGIQEQHVFANHILIRQEVTL